MADIAEPLPSVLVMDDAARRLGAPDHETFLADAPTSMKCAFKLICKLLMKHEYGPEGVWQSL
jgi:hypothetical protein